MRPRGRAWAVAALVAGAVACGGDGEGAGDTSSPERPAADEDSGGADRVLRGDESFPDGFTVPAGEVWELDPGVTTTVVSEANVVVEGTLRLRPSSAEVVHTLRFEGVDEAAFVGGGTEVLPTDVGLWVVGEGQLDVVGTERAGWNRTGTDPTWREGDDVRLAPMAPGDGSTFAAWSPSAGRAVPAVEHAGTAYAAEVFNLTRNARIEGTPGGRAHVWIGSSRPQVIRYAELRHLGPRPGSEAVAGRYPLHFHMAGEGSAGSLVEGVVVRDAGHHAFVPHASHGITFRDTVAFDVVEDAYWWDPDPTGPGEPAVNATNDLVIDHALAALVRPGLPRRPDDPLSGFTLGEGDGLTITDSVAVGVLGQPSAGFHWPASASGTDNVWTFRDGNVAHNNAGSGVFVWQNDENDHVVEDFVGYHNAAFGIEHGAALNTYRYDGLVLFANGAAGIRSVAGASGRPQEWHHVDTDGIVIGGRTIAGTEPVVFRDLVVRAPIVVDEPEGARPSAYELHDARGPDGAPLTPAGFDVRHRTSPITLHTPSGPVAL